MKMRLNLSRIVAMVALAALLAFHAFALSRPFLHAPAEVTEWRKGPLVKDHSPYATANSARIFWPVAAGMVDAYLLLLLLWRRVLRRKLRTRPPVEAAVATAVLLVVLVGGELAARGVIRQFWYLQYHPDPELYWYNRPNLRQHTDATDTARRTTNSMGFRMDREVSRDKGADEVRVFVVGDSSTFGLGVDDERTYSAVLERELNQRLGRPVTVINSGCPGHTSYQGMILLQRYGLDLQPDLVIWAYNNDPCLDTMLEKARVSDNPTQLAAQRVLYRSDLYLLFRRVLVDGVYGVRTARYAERYPSKPTDWVRRIPFDDFKDYLEQFADVAHGAGAEILYVRMPLNRPMCDVEPIYLTSFDDAYRDHLSTFCATTGQHCVDFEHPWLQAYDPGLFLPGHLFHPSATGHGIIGRELTKVIVEEGLVD
jgi:lysophospholipase L1-like esterase